MSEAIDILRHDHEAILVALQIIDQIAETARGNDLSSADANSFLGFLKEFADKCHHGKEEGMLFPAMLAAGLPEQGGPIPVMLQEHEQGRKFIAEMSKASGKDLDPAAFARAASAYSEHMRAHITKENEVLFPLAERVIDADTLKRMDGEFERHEEQVIGHGRHEELHAMLKELKAKYLPSAS